MSVGVWRVSVGVCRVSGGVIGGYKTHMGQFLQDGENACFMSKKKSK